MAIERTAIINIAVYDNLSVIFSPGYLYAGKSDTLLGPAYIKAIYQQYTDASFTVAMPNKKSRGFLGPAINASPGDNITVVFRNMASRPYSIHPIGVL